MSALFSTPKPPPQPKPVQPPKPLAPPPVLTAPVQTAAPQQAALKARRRKGTGLSGLILTPLGGGSNPTMPGATKSTLGS